MNLKYECQRCHQQFETEFPFNGFCPYCNYDYMTCLNFEQWDHMTGYGKRRMADLDRWRKKNLTNA